MTSIMLSLLDSLQLPALHGQPFSPLFILGMRTNMESSRMGCKSFTKATIRIAGVTSRPEALDAGALVPLRFGGCIIECPNPSPKQRINIMRSLTSHILTPFGKIILTPVRVFLNSPKATILTPYFWRSIR